jgi:recA bacterial DNA recombination protein
MALEVVDQLVRSSAVDIICVDSVAALVPRAEIEGEIGAVQGAPIPHKLQPEPANFYVLAKNNRCVHVDNGRGQEFFRAA